MKKAALFLSIFLMILITSCEDASSENDPASNLAENTAVFTVDGQSYTLTAGNITTYPNGIARFFSYRDEGGRFHTLIVGISVPSGSNLQSGEYPIDDKDWELDKSVSDGYVYYQIHNLASTYSVKYDALSGKVNVTSLTSNNVRGTFEGRAQFIDVLNASNNRETNFSGSFNFAYNF